VAEKSGYNSWRGASHPLCIGLAFPAWAIIKMVLWLILGALLPFAYRQARRATTSGDNAVDEKAGDLLWWLLLGVGFLAAYVGVSWRGW
jgi:hypothetical protein